MARFLILDALSMISCEQRTSFCLFSISLRSSWGTGYNTSLSFRFASWLDLNIYDETGQTR